MIFKKNKTPVIAPFFVPYPKYLRPHVLCGQVAREWRIVARQVPVRHVYLNQQWWKGGEKKGPTKSGWKQIGDQNNATKTITNFDSEILSLEVFRFFCELEAFRFSPAVGSVSSMLFLLCSHHVGQRDGGKFVSQLFLLPLVAAFSIFMALLPCLKGLASRWRWKSRCSMNHLSKRVWPRHKRRTANH